MQPNHTSFACELNIKCALLLGAALGVATFLVCGVQYTTNLVHVEASITRQIGYHAISSRTPPTTSVPIFDDNHASMEHELKISEQHQQRPALQLVADGWPKVSLVYRRLCRAWNVRNVRACSRGATMVWAGSKFNVCFALFT